MKVRHETVIALDGEMGAVALRKALDEVPDHARINAEVSVIEADRPWESRRTSVRLRAQWEGPAFT